MSPLHRAAIGVPVHHSGLAFMQRAAPPRRDGSGLNHASAFDPAPYMRTHAPAADTHDGNIMIGLVNGIAITVAAVAAVWWVATC